MARFSKYLGFIVSALLCVALLPSCDNSDDIGDLYGMWQLREVSCDGTVEQPRDLYLCFQSQYVDARIVSVEGHGSSNAFGHYTDKGSIMQITFYYADGIAPGNPPSDPHNPAEFLRNFHFIDYNPVTDPAGNTPVRLTFDVEERSSSHMVLSNEHGKWVFVKF